MNILYFVVVQYSTMVFKKQETIVIILDRHLRIGVKIMLLVLKT